jgi:hypothetical protein
MSDADSDANAISDSRNAHISEADGAEDSSISSAVRELCDRVRANDPRGPSLDGLINSVDGKQSRESAVVGSFLLCLQNDV